MITSRPLLSKLIVKSCLKDGIYGGLRWRNKSGNPLKLLLFYMTSVNKESVHFYKLTIMYFKIFLIQVGEHPSGIYEVLKRNLTCLLRTSLSL